MTESICGTKGGLHVNVHVPRRVNQHQSSVPNEWLADSEISHSHKVSQLLERFITRSATV